MDVGCHDNSMNVASESFLEASNRRNSLLGPKEHLKIGAWNVRTMYECGKTAQVVKEMQSYKIDILCVSECRWTDCGSVVTSSGETIIYSGRKDNKHQQGVAIIMNKKAKRALIEWSPIDERLISARFHSKYAKMTIIQCYAPTNDADDDIKTTFYEKLQSIVSKTPRHDILIVLGDMNAKVGDDNRERERIMGKHGHGSMNENGELLTDFCGINDLIIGGTLFQHKTIHKITWNSPNGRDKNQIDHLMINGRWKNSLCDVRAMRGADCSSDHHLIIGKINLKLRKAKGNDTNKREIFDTTKLKNIDAQKKFKIELRNQFRILEDLNETENSTVESLEMAWSEIQTMYRETSKNTLGYRKRERKQWISDNTWNSIQERKDIKRKINNAKSERIQISLQKEYTSKDKEVKQKAKADRKKYLETLAEEAETAASKGQLSTVYRITKQLSGKLTSSNIPCKSKDGKVLTSESQQLERWTEHFREILNIDHQNVIPNIEQFGEELDIDIEEVSREEIRKAILKLKNGKSPGLDAITAEMIKADMETSTTVFYKLFQHIWKHNTIPKDWAKGLIIKLPKKGDLSDCNNWRGITLLSVPSKILLRVLLNRMNEAINEKLRNEQAGFRSGKGCIDHIFTIRNIIEQSIEWQNKLILNFIDFRKAFDSIKRSCIWSILRAYGLPSKFITLIQAFYNNYECCVLHNGQQSEWFSVTSGVRQGCIISPILFITAVDWCMRTTLGNEITGIRWTMNSFLEDLDFADDICLLSSNKNNMQSKTSRLNEVAQSVGLNINEKKTKVMTVHSDTQQPVTIDNNNIEEVEDFTYLGSMISNNNGTAKDIKVRIRKARNAFCQLQSIWRSGSISLKTKLKIYTSNVKAVLLYGSECWRIIQTDMNKLSSFHNTCLRKICKIFWPNKITNKDLYQKTNQCCIETEIKRKRWRWIGHVMRKESDDITKIALRWTPDGRRKRGRPKETWRRMVEQEMKDMGMTWREIEKKAKDRQLWRALVTALCADGHEEDK